MCLLPLLNPQIFQRSQLPIPLLLHPPLLRPLHFQPLSTPLQHCHSGRDLLDHWRVSPAVQRGAEKEKEEEDWGSCDGGEEDGHALSICLCVPVCMHALVCVCYVCMCVCLSHAMVHWTSQYLTLYMCAPSSSSSSSCLLLSDWTEHSGALWLNRMGHGLCVHVLHFWYLFMLLAVQSY